MLARPTQVACLFALACVLVGCASRQSALAERQGGAVVEIDGEAEEDLLFACSLEELANASIAIRGQDNELRHTMSEWVEAGDERSRVTVQVYTHPELGPGLELVTRRESRVESGWAPVMPNAADRELRRRLSEGIRACWEARSVHGSPSES